MTEELAQALGGPPVDADALAVMERDRIIEPGSFMETVHESPGPNRRIGPPT